MACESCLDLTRNAREWRQVVEDRKARVASAEAQLGTVVGALADHQATHPFRYGRRA